MYIYISLFNTRKHWKTLAMRSHPSPTPLISARTAALWHAAKDICPIALAAHQTL